jgi:hypothetical protein
MTSTPVSKDQFKISADGITHVPSGANYKPHPGSPHSGNANWANLGNVLSNGELSVGGGQADDGAVVGGVCRSESGQVLDANEFGSAAPR